MLYCCYFHCLFFRDLLMKTQRKMYLRQRVMIAELAETFCIREVCLSILLYTVWSVYIVICTCICLCVSPMSACCLYNYIHVVFVPLSVCLLLFTVYSYSNMCLSSVCTCIWCLLLIHFIIIITIDE